MIIQALWINKNTSVKNHSPSSQQIEQINKVKNELKENIEQLNKLYEEANTLGKKINSNEHIQYKNKLKKLNEEINSKINLDKKVYGIILNLTLYPGDNPSIMDKQKYKCKKSFDDLKNEYCNVFGIGCKENNKSGGNNKSIKNVEKYTMKKKYTIKKM